MPAMQNLFQKAAEEAHANFQWSRTAEGAKGWEAMEAIIIRSWAESILSMKRTELVLISLRVFFYETLLVPFSFFSRAKDHPIYTLFSVLVMIYVASQVLHLSFGIPILVITLLALQLFAAPGFQRSNALLLANILTAGRHLRKFAEELREYPTTYRHMSDVEFGTFLPKINIVANEETKAVYDGLFKLYWARQHMGNPEISLEIQAMIERMIHANDRRYRKIAVEINSRINSLSRPSHHDELCLSEEIFPKLKSMQPQ